MKTQHNTATASRRWRFLAFPALAALALTLALPRPASAETFVFHSQNYINVLQGEGSNSCIAGGFVVTGVAHQVLELNLSGASLDSVFHFINHENVQLTGTDGQGNKWIGNLTQSTSFTGVVGQEITVPLSLALVSQGAAPNFIVHAILHFTVNANGTVTSSINNLTTICAG